MDTDYYLKQRASHFPKPESMKTLVEHVARGFTDPYYPIPEHMWYGIMDYLTLGIPPGGFLGAVLANTLVEAAGHADELNKQSLANYASLLQNYIPVSAWGSEARVKEWCESGGWDKIFAKV